MQEQDREDFLHIWESEGIEEKSPRECVFPIEIKEEKSLELQESPLEVQEAPLEIQANSSVKSITNKKELHLETNLPSEGMHQLNLCISPSPKIFSPLTNDYTPFIKEESGFISPSIMSPSRRKNTFAMMSPSLNKKRRKAADKVQIREEEIKEFIPDINLVLIFLSVFRILFFFFSLVK